MSEQEVYELSFKARWSTIDRSASSDEFVRFMDAFRPQDTDNLQGYSPYRIIAAFLQIHEGDQLLDVGCGTGGAVRAMAQLVGNRGRVIGIDSSNTMISEAHRRTQNPYLSVEYVVGDAHTLPFPENSFNGCFSIGSFEVLDNPLRVLAEMIRVIKPGGRIAINGSDMGLWAIDSSHRDVSRKLLNFVSDHETNGWLGRQLPRLYKEYGLTEVTIVPHTSIIPRYELLKPWFDQWLDNAQVAGVVTAAERTEWVEELEQRSLAGLFFAAITVLYVSGCKPQ